MENLESVKQVAYDLANLYERNYGCCSQCVLAALRNTIGMDKISDSVFRASTGLGAGIGGAGYACGALSGGVMAISCFVGRDFDNMLDPDGVRFTTFRLGRKLVERFEQEYGVNGGDCSAIQTKLMGRSYDIMRGERDEFIANGGHTTICPDVCGKAAAWVIDILAEEGLI